MNEPRDVVVILPNPINVQCIIFEQNSTMTKNILYGTIRTYIDFDIFYRKKPFSVQSSAIDFYIPNF